MHLVLILVRFSKFSSIFPTNLDHARLCDEAVFVHDIDSRLIDNLCLHAAHLETVHIVPEMQNFAHQFVILETS
jgi:hypothetical protein